MLSPLSSEVTTTTVRRGSLYSVVVRTQVAASPGHQSQYFICQLTIPRTGVSRTEQTVFFPGILSSYKTNEIKCE